MTDKPCTEIELMLQADIDGELDAAGAAVVAAHVAQCADCAAARAALTTLSSRLRSEVAYHAAPPRLRAAVMETVAAGAARDRPAPTRIPGRSWFGRLDAWIQRGVSFGAGAAVAAALALGVFGGPAADMAADVADRVVAGHIRALQPGHLMDVASTDQHTVKPWFDGRLDYAPPVRDLAAVGFPLVGGRLDYLAGRPVAALAYRRAQHVIDLYIWPARQGAATSPETGARSGYNYRSWTRDGMVFWAVSDVNPAELGQFADAWRSAP